MLCLCTCFCKFYVILVIVSFFFFFFSSRRRHTRYWRDWSSDVCSSDLRTGGTAGGAARAVVRWPRGARRRSAVPGERHPRTRHPAGTARGGGRALPQIGRASCRERV